MMNFLCFALISFALYYSTANATTSCSPIYAQCAGTYWTGATCCEEGSYCFYQSQWYSQCMPEVPGAHVNYNSSLSTFSTTPATVLTNAPTTIVDNIPTTIVGNTSTTIVGSTPATVIDSTSSSIFDNTPSRASAETSTSSLITSKSALSTSTSTTENSCSYWYGQCGGVYWDGSTCCSTGSDCVDHSIYYSQCVPRANTGLCQSIYSQCGGDNYSGETCCQEGTECAVIDSGYSQCIGLPGVLYGSGDANSPGVLSSSTSATVIAVSSEYNAVSDTSSGIVSWPSTPQSNLSTFAQVPSTTFSTVTSIPV